MYDVCRQLKDLLSKLEVTWKKAGWIFCEPGRYRVVDDVSLRL